MVNKTLSIIFLSLFILFTVIYYTNEDPFAKPILIYSAGYCAGLAGDKITEIIITHWS